VGRIALVAVSIAVGWAALVALSIAIAVANLSFDERVAVASCSLAGSKDEGDAVGCDEAQAVSRIGIMKMEKIRRTFFI
jgi:hypothetical protein